MQVDFLRLVDWVRHTTRERISLQVSFFPGIGVIETDEQNGMGGSAALTFNCYLS